MTASSSGQSPLVYVGTYTANGGTAHGKAEGIYVFRLDVGSGALSLQHTTTGIRNPSYLAIHPSKRFLYSVVEVIKEDGREGGAVAAFSIDQQTGALTHLNTQPSHGEDPCHLSVDATGQAVVVANYTSGSIASYPILADGRLGDAASIIQHEGSSINPRRQQGPHAHSANIDLHNRFVIVADLGMDKVLTYHLELPSAKLVPGTHPFVAAQPGVGPRHVAFHPNKRLVYVINEIGSSVTGYHYHERSGQLEPIETLSTLPEGWQGTSHCADIHIAPDGRFVYGSNRGHDSLAIFEIDEASGRLTARGHASTHGRVPRNFTIDDAGDLVLAANQNTDNIVPFHVNKETGALTRTGHDTHCLTPVCLKIVRL